MNVFEAADPDTDRLVGRMREVEARAAREHGAFSLFALLERKAALGRWDVLVAAPWLPEGREGILRVARVVTDLLPPEDSVRVARIVPIPADSDVASALRQVHAAGPGDEAVTLLGDATLGGVEIARGYVLAAEPPTRQAMDAAA